MPPRHRLRGTVAVALIAIGSLAGQAFADTNADSFFLVIKPNATLGPVLHAKEGLASPENGREYDYVTKGYFKVGGKTVGRLPTITGHADASRETLTLKVSRATRSKVNAAARRGQSRRVILTLTHRITLTTNIPGDMAPRTERLTQQVPLRIAG